VRGVGFGDQAVLDLDHAVGVIFQARIVGDADHRRAVLLGRAAEQADHHLAVLAVEGGSGLVGKKQLRLLGDSAGDGDALLLTARKLSRTQMQALGETHFGQGFGGRAARLVRIQPGVFQHGGDLL
jgi:hypothetical protein